MWLQEEYLWSKNVSQKSKVIYKNWQIKQWHVQSNKKNQAHQVLTINKDTIEVVANFIYFVVGISKTETKIKMYKPLSGYAVLQLQYLDYNTEDRWHHKHIWKKDV